MSPEELRSTFASTTGGVMTEEVGAVTGEMELLTRPAEGAIEVLIRYAGAEEWYTVEGSPLPLGNTNASPAELHERVVRHLTQPGEVVDGNERSVSLTSFEVA